MRHLSRLLVLAAVTLLTAGPLLAAPLVRQPGGTAIGPVSAGRSSPAAALWLLGSSLALFGAVKVKDNATITRKYVTRAGQAAPDYKSGVETAGGDWEAGARAGEGNFEQGVQDAIARKAYGKGVSGAAGKYTKNATTLGVQRYPQGVANADQAYQAGVAPYLDVIRNLSLPPKGPRRSPQNQQRANMVALELGKKKTQG